MNVEAAVPVSTVNAATVADEACTIEVILISPSEKVESPAMHIVRVVPRSSETGVYEASLADMTV